MSLPKNYNPKENERAIYDKWEKSGYFTPEKLSNAKKRKPFTISMPPPNVTGDLHLGHALVLTIQDIMIRYQRLNGRKTLWLPGTDSAGIGTTVVVEKKLSEKGLNRHDLGRDKFLAEVKKWVAETRPKIVEQTKTMGASCDWSREKFTMDKDMYFAVQESFIRLYNDNKIYRDLRLTNFCTRCESVVSDLEVKYEDRQGKLWYFKYPLKDSEEFIVVATTRPETMLGDTAVAVNPDDKRYQKYIGQILVLPIIGREIPVIKDRLVDKDFGTGVVKVTPAHDPNDFTMGQRHKLPAISVINKEGKMTTAAGKDFQDLESIKARQKVVEKMEKLGLLEKEEDYKHSVGLCERCSSVIEPLLTTQWFVDVKLLADKALAAVKTGKTKIVPERFNKLYYNWLANIQDWCISRQIWWGHQVPAYYCKDCYDETLYGKGKKRKGIHVGLKPPKKCNDCGSSKIYQDEDTLDTWFSSGLWTFSTLGWPKNEGKKNSDLQEFHPTDVMETGWDLIFFWVARMMMLSLYFLDEVPFKTIYFHGMILDPKTGQKMSKSKGTGIDPLLMTAKYGTDALRMALVVGTRAGQDLKLHEEKIAGYRNFSNKIWNIARYLTDSKGFSGKIPRTLKSETLADKWILSRLENLKEEIKESFTTYRYGDAGQKLYDFVWHELADWYVEISKIQANEKITADVLTKVLSEVLIMLHPFIPFITETIWADIQEKDELLIVAAWPKAKPAAKNTRAENEFANLQEIITTVRNVRAEYQIKPNEKLDIFVSDKTACKQKEIIEYLSRCYLKNKIGKEKGILKIALKKGYVAIDLRGKIDVTREKVRLENERKEVAKYLEGIERKLQNEKFMAGAPEEVVELEKKKQTSFSERLKIIDKHLGEL
ncbi:MAG: valine--tRNA ligase [bacterium]